MTKDLAILHGNIVTPDRTLSEGDLLIREGKILVLGPTGSTPIPPDAEQIDARGLIVAPGYIDAHTHGGNGHDYMDSSLEDIRSTLRWLPSTGVTAVLPTLASAELKDALEMVARLHEVQEHQVAGEPILLGIHLEGPYLSMAKRGAQPEKAIRKPSIAEMEQLIEASDCSIHLVTLAPELPGALELIHFLVQRGIVVSAGHTEASCAQVMAAAQAGLSRVTHLYNGMSSFDHRNPGIIGAALTNDAIYAELILDGIHVDPVAANVALRAKGIDKVVLMTDATQAAGRGDGVYIRPGNRRITVKEGAARLDSGSLAGSVLTLDRAVRNAVNLLHLPLADAVTLATRSAANSLGLGAAKGTLAPGKDADIVILGENLEVRSTLVGGVVVYCA
jgi:N-acetylglucosamine-6-phosphate deacetylase